MSIFNQSQRTKVKKNKFDLSHDKKLSLQMGKLVPILLQEVLPGDSFNIKSEIMMRLAPMIAPVMHRVNVYVHYFFVPNRIIWDNWEDFITGGPDGTLAPVHPNILFDTANQAEMAPGTLADYLGLPEAANQAPGIFTRINSLPFRAYLNIYNEYYRDQTLEPEIFFSKGDGQEAPPSSANLLEMRFRAWEKDYFTSAMPWAQRGPEVTLPLSYSPTSTVIETGTDAPPAAAGNLTSQAGSGELIAGTPAAFSRIENLEIQDATISNLRKAVRLQEWLEKNARGGARYIEQLLAHFGRAPKDARLQRPEYLGGAKQPIVISEVLNTAGSTTIDLQPVGEMSGHGISVGSSAGFTRTFDEHGQLLGIMSVIPRSSYMQGIPKQMMKDDKFDYAWPEFANIGEQPILQKELYYDGAAENLGTFGYTPRYAEYKYGISTVHGEFKTNLDFWHIARKFTGLPPLTSDFIKCTPSETKRIFAVTDPDTDDLYCQIFHNISAIRPLPYFGTPKL